MEIRLVGPNKPNTARWESFGWAIPADWEHAYYKRSAQDERIRKDPRASALGKLTPEERAVVEAAMGGRR